MSSKEDVEENERHGRFAIAFDSNGTSSARDMDTSFRTFETDKMYKRVPNC